MFSLRPDGFAGAKALWFVSAVLGDDGGRLDESISVPEDELIHAPFQPWRLNRVIRLKPGKTVSGTVLEEATRKPITDATVFAEDGRVVATDARGRFTLRGLPADVVGFIVMSPGLVRTPFNVDVSERAAADGRAAAHIHR